MALLIGTARHCPSMKTFPLLFALLIISGLFHVTTPAFNAAENDVAVIVNPANPANSISSAELRTIFSGEKIAWNGSLAVVPFVRNGKVHERHVLLDLILRMSETGYHDYWLRKTRAGSSIGEPLGLYSNGMQLEAVRSHKGGIALIKAMDVKAGVKVIKVDGLLPGNPGYPLR